MKPDEDVRAAALPACDKLRRPWTAPSTRRLRTSAAEVGSGTDLDGVEVFS
jgi:hypothetical protein